MLSRPITRCATTVPRAFGTVTPVHAASAAGVTSVNFNDPMQAFKVQFRAFRGISRCKRSPRPSLTAVQNKSTWELVRAWVVFGASSKPWLINNHDSLFRLADRVCGQFVVDRVLKVSLAYSNCNDHCIISGISSAGIILRALLRW
jgi:hypothetical protein